MTQLLAMGYGRGVQADGGVVQEDAAVHLSDIHLRDVPPLDRPHRLIEIQGDADVLGEVVERTEGQDAEGFVATHQCRRTRAQGAVTAAEDDHVRVRGGRPSVRRRESPRG